jgi:hypothetical protein
LAPKQPKDPPAPPPRANSPDDITTVPGGGAASDRTYDIAVKLASVEASVTMLVAHVEDLRKEMRTLQGQVTGIDLKITRAEGSLDAVEKIGKSVVKGVWALFIAVVGIAGTILAMWVKHHFGW